MKKGELTFIFIAASLIALIIESSLISFPFIFFLGSFMLFFFKKIHIYAIVFLNAFIIDSLRVVNFSYTPLFLIATISMILLYEKYSGSNDPLVATLIIFMTGVIYVHYMSYSLFVTISLCFFVTIFYVVFQILKKRRIFA